MLKVGRGHLCRRLRTRFIEATHNPVWNERHEVYLADEADTIKLWVKVGQKRLGHGSSRKHWTPHDRTFMQDTAGSWIISSVA